MLGWGFMLMECARHCRPTHFSVFVTLLMKLLHSLRFVAAMHWLPCDSCNSICPVKCLPPSVFLFVFHLSLSPSRLPIWPNYCSFCFTTVLVSLLFSISCRILSLVPLAVHVMHKFSPTTHIKSFNFSLICSIDMFHMQMLLSEWSRGILAWSYCSFKGTLSDYLWF